MIRVMEGEIVGDRVRSFCGLLLGIASISRRALTVS